MRRRGRTTDWRPRGATEMALHVLAYNLTRVLNCQPNVISSALIPRTDAKPKSLGLGRSPIRTRGTCAPVSAGRSAGGPKTPLEVTLRLDHHMGAGHFGLKIDKNRRCSYRAVSTRRRTGRVYAAALESCL